MAKKEVVLAFSGGLDTSFCIPYLKEQGFDVVTLFVDSGGVTKEEREYIQARAHELGSVHHETAEVGEELWREVVVPLVKGGVLYQDRYPLLCSDRYVIVRKSLELAKKRNTKFFAHGCTGMGNDQVRFDLSVHALGDYEILAPIRDVQDGRGLESRPINVREHEQKYLEARGFSVRAKTTKYSINQNALGVTTSGAEIDQFGTPGSETYVLTTPRDKWPTSSLTVKLGFDRGECVSVDGKQLAGPQILALLNERFGAYGVGRDIYTGDTTIGLKGRIVFECPGIMALLEAHRALEETVLTREQNVFKKTSARTWVDLVYRGLFFEPLKFDIEVLLDSTQRFVTGEVTLETHGGTVLPVAVDSKHMLKNPKAVYAQSSDWTAANAEGFIRLFGQSTTLSTRVNPRG
jgi:argininosuccinate synthase